jgi:hypothetical protein
MSTQVREQTSNGVRLLAGTRLSFTLRGETHGVDALKLNCAVPTLLNLERVLAGKAAAARKLENQQ